MKCVVTTNFAIWDFGTIAEARRKFKEVVKCTLSGNTYEGDEVIYVVLWRASDFYRSCSDCMPIQEWFNPRYDYGFETPGE